MASQWSVVLFYSTSAAIRAESLAQQAGMTVRLIPVPRQLSSDCGVCLRFELRDTDSLCTILEDKNVEYDAVKPL